MKLIINALQKKFILVMMLDLTIPEPKKASLNLMNYKLEYSYEDEDLLVINKPAGIVMHPGAGNFDNTIVNALMNYDKNSLSTIGDELKTWNSS